MLDHCQAAKKLDGQKGYASPGPGKVSALTAVDLVCGVCPVESEVTLDRGKTAQVQTVEYGQFRAMNGELVTLPLYVEPQHEVGEAEQPMAPVKSASLDQIMAEKAAIIQAEYARAHDALGRSVRGA